ncbi:hypothetical protein ABZ349_29115, partial [Streptomyces niveus]
DLPDLAYNNVKFAKGTNSRFAVGTRSVDMGIPPGSGWDTAILCTACAARPPPARLVLAGSVRQPVRPQSPDRLK